MCRPFVILKTGSTIPTTRGSRGDFEDWFMAGIGLPRERVLVVDLQAGDPMPRPDAPSGVLVTGSPAMVSQRALWSEAAACWLREVVAAEIPLLAVCFGHQLLAHAMGGEVGRNPRGTYIGTVEARRAPDAFDDPLLGELPATFKVQVSHEEAVLVLPPGARILITADHDPHLAFTLGRAAWGVQFHPEFDAGIVRDYLRARSQLLTSLGQDVDGLFAAVEECPQGPRLLRRFAAMLKE